MVSERVDCQTALFVTAKIAKKNTRAPLIIHIILKRKVIIFVISNAGTTGPGSEFEFFAVKKGNGNLTVGGIFAKNCSCLESPKFVMIP